MIDKKISEFSEIIFAIKDKNDIKGFPWSYHYGYMFINDENYWYQLPSTEHSNNGKHLYTKEQFNSRLRYLLSNNCIFEEIVIDREHSANILIVKFINTKLVKGY